MRIDLNADLGEGFGPWTMGDDAAMLDLVTTANVACGFHAGDPAIMRLTAERARARGVAVGAHPGLADLAGFGRRRPAGITAREVEALVACQTGAFAAVAALAGHRATHVKAHGALANMAAEDEGLARALARAVRAVDPGLALMVMPGTALPAAAEREGLRPIAEIYADRAYAPDFTLAARGLPGAVIHDPAVAVARVLAMLRAGAILAEGGGRLPAAIESVCVHGDNPAAVAMARQLRAGLGAEGFTLAPVAGGPGGPGGRGAGGG
ncbi:MAG: LamB/YcsF family protein [Rhodobacteraceae bacterium]|nr:LamB/YcsF family protein [Paracoccaceae bacterium]